MTIEEAIKHAEEVAEEKENLANTYESFRDYGNPKSSITSGHKKCLNCAEEHRQLAEWLKELKAYKEQEPCEDAISKQAVLDTVKEYQSGFESVMNIGGKVSMEELAEDIKLLNSSVTPKQKWIPVSERLPKRNGYYLVTGRQGAVNKRLYQDGHWYGNWAILAWMPLPKPYTAESEGKE